MPGVNLEAGISCHYKFSKILVQLTVVTRRDASKKTIGEANEGIDDYVAFSSLKFTFERYGRS